MKDILLRLGRSYMKKPKKLIIDASNEIQRLRARVADLEKTDRDLRITISDMHADNVVHRNSIMSLCTQIETEQTPRMNNPPVKIKVPEYVHTLEIWSPDGVCRITFDPDKSS